MSLLSRESSQPLTEQLAQRFVARMRDQLLVSGARLPSVRQCAQMHGVSASTVVAAYDWLVAQGWVEARPNRGFFVRDRAQRTPPASVLAGGGVASPPPVNASSLIRGMFHQPSAEPQPGMGVSLNGIAQGYAADLVRASLKRDGVAHALINTGEWSSLGLANGERPWVLGIADPHQAHRLITRLRMRGGCVATSADDQCSFSADRVHHHILNPETGYSPLDISSVTVIASTCTEADALTKVLFVAGYENALHTAHAHRVEALIVHKNEQWKATPSLSQYLFT